MQIKYVIQFKLQNKNKHKIWLPKFQNKYLLSLQINLNKACSNEHVSIVLFKIICYTLHFSLIALAVFISKWPNTYWIFDLNA